MAERAVALGAATSPTRRLAQIGQRLSGVPRTQERIRRVHQDHVSQERLIGVLGTLEEQL